MDWNAVALELGLLALAIVVLAWDLTFGHGPGRSRRGHYAIGLVGLAGLFAWSFRLPVDIHFTAALVQDVGQELEQVGAVQAPLDFLDLLLVEGLEDILAKRLGVTLLDRFLG